MPTRSAILSTAALALGVGTMTLRAAVIETTDGARLEGTVRLDKGILFIRAADGSEKQIASESIRRALLNDSLKKETAPAAIKPSAKPLEKLEAPRKVEGLLGEYSDVDFKDRKLLRVDPKVDFEFPEKDPTDPAVPTDFAVRWTGQVQASDDGKHIFSVELHSHDEKVRVWLDEELIIDRWTDKNAGYTGAVDLKADQKYTLKVEYLDERSWGRIRLYWSSPRQGRQVVPTSRLTPPPGTVPPMAQIISPTEGASFVGMPAIPLEAEALDRDGSVKRVEFLVNGAVVGISDASPWKAHWKSPTAGVHKLQAKVTDDGGLSATSPATTFAVAASNARLPSPWAEIPLGRTYDIATASASDESFTLRSAGGDVWGERDAMQFVLQPLPGDGSLVARLVRFDAPKASDGTGAAAGLLLREHLNPGGARQAFVGLAPQVGVIFLRREHAWDERKLTEEEGLALPRWLRLSRSGKNVTAYHSEDGKRWISLSTRRIDMASDAYLGLAVGNPSSTPATAVFDNVRFVRGDGSGENSVRGVLLASGSIIAGNIQSADETSVKLAGRYGSVSIPASQVARIIFRPVSSEAAEQIQPGRTGAVLGNGDFFDADIESLRDGHVRMGSVLFGVRRYSLQNDDINALILRDAGATPAKFDVRGVEGSLFRCASIAIEKDRVVLTEQRGTRFLLRIEDIVDIAATP